MSTAVRQSVMSSVGRLVGSSHRSGSHSCKSSVMVSCLQAVSHVTCRSVGRVLAPVHGRPLIQIIIHVSCRQAVSHGIGRSANQVITPVGRPNIQVLSHMSNAVSQSVMGMCANARTGRCLDMCMAHARPLHVRSFDAVMLSVDRSVGPSRPPNGGQHSHQS